LLHPNKRLQTPWKYAQLGLLIFPLIPWLGALGLFLALVGTWRRQYHDIIHRPLNWILAVLAGWLVITSGLAVYPLDAFLGLFNFLPFFSFFAAFSALIQTPAQLRQLAYILVVTSVPVVLIGLGQLFWGWVSPVELQGILGWVLTPQGNPPGRIASVFMYTNVLAGYLVIIFILALGLLITSFQEPKGQKNSSPRPTLREAACASTSHSSRSRLRVYIPRLFLTVAVIGNLVALILTNSRNAWAIAVCAGITFAIYQGWRWLEVGVAAIAGSVLGAAFGPSPLRQWLRQVVPSFFWQRLTDQLYPNRPLGSLRKTQWRFAWNLTQQRPWTGWGLRNFTPLYEAQMHAWLGHPHNFFLMLTAEIGIPATILFCGWISWVVFQGIQLLSDWSRMGRTGEGAIAQDRLIFFSYLLAFAACILFNTVDVSLFDLRLNTLGWFLLSAIGGVVYHYRD